ncbi:hypothetical protein BWQ96_10608 [Gracilariopsis chorda]|uniref:Tenascin-X n=1 Tax=Gracilariopsis chorda TaxID=448386 RepID=A0A2V3IC96_9FLOR|nr:hypothetical protein BWQ96_10608 [Gracilariopsis chorda]|eukprot:PXF39691.1 hypothetical protein BWQ96_10608 [Gracilariopsis chorda]
MLRCAIILLFATICAATPNVRTAYNPRRACQFCPENKVCAGRGRVRRCVTPMTVGKSCRVDPFWVCAKGLKCQKNVCVDQSLIVRGDCTRPYSFCPRGSVCAGTEERKLCVQPIRLGSQCGKNQFFVCESGLECVDGICTAPKVPEGGNCLTARSVCVDGTVCAGTNTRKKCVTPMSVGGRCGQDPFWICEAGLDCVDGTCTKPKIPKGGDCLPEGSVCVDGTVCAGTDTKKQCVTLMSVGGRCGQDPFWICEAGLDCVDGTCTKPKIPKGGDCLPEGSVCVDGTICAGTDTKKQCVTPMSVGGRCGQDPFWICEAGLDCVDGTCTKPKIPKGGDCLPEGSVCVDGTICAGTDTKKQCVTPMSVGGRCGQDPFWICEAGLDCVDGTCTKPKIPKGGDCLPEGSVCVDGTICAGTDTKKQCVTPMSVGGRCGQDPFWICEAGLDCVDGTCTKPKIPKGGDCLPEGSVCVDGTICAGTDTKKQCVTPMSVGGRCGQDPFWICESGLVCEGGLCAKPRIPLGGDCKPEGSVCEDGLICAGDNGLKKCVKGMGEGDRCGLDPFWVCKPGLTCVHRICVKH